MGVRGFALFSCVKAFWKHLYREEFGLLLGMEYEGAASGPGCRRVKDARPLLIYDLPTGGLLCANFGKGWRNGLKWRVELLAVGELDTCPVIVRILVFFVYSLSFLIKSSLYLLPRGVQKKGVGVGNI